MDLPVPPGGEVWVADCPAPPSGVSPSRISYGAWAGRAATTPNASCVVGAGSAIVPKPYMPPPGETGTGPSPFTVGERLYGCRQALHAAGLPYDEALVAMGVPVRARV